MTSSLKPKYDILLSSEQAWANAVARSVIKARPITVWEVLIPVLFIFNYARSRNEQDVFIKNLIFTKELAIRAAFSIAKNNLSRKEAIGWVEEKTLGLLTSVKNGLYSEEIRGKQMEEIFLLVDHYGRLLQVEGDNYNSLVKNAYGNFESYSDFLIKLEKAEKAVNSAALRTLAEKGDPEMVTRIEKSMTGVRIRMAHDIF